MNRIFPQLSSLSVAFFAAVCLYCKRTYDINSSLETVGVKGRERKESIEGYIWVKSGHFVNIFEDGYFFAALKKG